MAHISIGILVTVLGKFVNSKLGTSVERVPALYTMVVSISHRIITAPAMYIQTPTPQKVNIVNSKEMSDVDPLVVVYCVGIAVQCLLLRTEYTISIYILAFWYIVY